MLPPVQSDAEPIRRPWPPPHPARATTAFEHRGVGTLTVLGPVTGKRYRFAGYGARVEVDVRDRLSVRAVGALREVRLH